LGITDRSSDGKRRSPQRLDRTGHGRLKDLSRKALIAALHTRSETTPDAIVFLIHLWIRPIPTELDRLKTEAAQKRRETLLDMGKGFVDRNMFAQMRLALEPEV